MLHENIKRIREKNNIGQKQFADLLEVKSPQVSRWEKEELGINIHVVAKMAKILNVSIDQLYYGEEYSSEENILVELERIQKELDAIKEQIPTP